MCVCPRSMCHSVCRLCLEVCLTSLISLLDMLHTIGHLGIYSIKHFIFYIPTFLLCVGCLSSPCMIQPKYLLLITHFIFGHCTSPQIHFIFRHCTSPQKHFIFGQLNLIYLILNKFCQLFFLAIYQEIDNGTGNHIQVLIEN